MCSRYFEAPFILPVSVNYRNFMVLQQYHRSHHWVASRCRSFSPSPNCWLFPIELVFPSQQWRVLSTPLWFPRKTWYFTKTNKEGKYQVLIWLLMTFSPCCVLVPNCFNQMSAGEPLIAPYLSIDPLVFSCIFKWHVGYVHPPGFTNFPPRDSEPHQHKSVKSESLLNWCDSFPRPDYFFENCSQ